MNRAIEPADLIAIIQQLLASSPAFMRDSLPDDIELLTTMAVQLKEYEEQLRPLLEYAEDCFNRFNSSYHDTEAVYNLLVVLKKFRLLVNIVQDMHEQALLALGKPQPVMQFINMLSKKIFAGCMDVIISNNVLFVDVSADGNNMPIVELMVNEDGGKTAKILDAHERNLRYAASIIRKALAWLALSVESITTLKQVVLSVHAQDTKCILSIKADATAAKKMLNVNNKNYRFGLNNLNRFDSRFAVEEGTGELLRVEAWSKPTIMSATRIENTPQLSSVSPQRFEQIIRDLIDKMGLEVVLTKQTRDGGIDIDAYDMRPIVGGRVIVQCKRYSNPVGVVAVRELAGVMHQEKASKGVIITTSGFTTDAKRFAEREGGRIELIDGEMLQRLLIAFDMVEGK